MTIDPEKIDMGGLKPPMISLSLEECQGLETLVRRHTTAQQVAHMAFAIAYHPWCLSRGKLVLRLWAYAIPMMQLCWDTFVEQLARDGLVALMVDISVAGVTVLSLAFEALRSAQTLGAPPNQGQLMIAMYPAA